MCVLILIQLLHVYTHHHMYINIEVWFTVGDIAWTVSNAISVGVTFGVINFIEAVTVAEIWIDLVTPFSRNCQNFFGVFAGVRMSAYVYMYTYYICIHVYTCIYIYINWGIIPICNIYHVSVHISYMIHLLMSICSFL